MTSATRQYLRVLVVEDAADDAELLLRELQRGGYEVTYDLVETAAAMRAALEGSTWDLVISDYSMPGFTALDALALVKSTGQDLPFIIFSGTIGEETAVAALQAGADDFLVKGRLARLLPAIARIRQDAFTRAERRRATEALARSEAQYRSLVERAVFGICRATTDGRLVTVNPALVAMLRYPSTDALCAVALSDLFVEDAGRTTLQQRIKAGARFLGEEVLWRPKSGDPIRVRLSGAFPEASDHGLPVFELFVEDITEAHRLQDQLRQAQKMEAIGQLAGGVAHDFNNLLTAILGFGGLLAEQIVPDAPGGSDVREIIGAAERAAALTKQLLAFSRKQAITLTPLDLNEVVRKLHPMMTRLLSGAIQIQLQLGQDLDCVMADTTQMEQVLINLAVNARDAMPDGGTLTIETRNTVREGEFRAMNLGGDPASFAMVRVTDTGVGMSSRITARIFEPFFTTKERGKGTGMGLAAVYGILKQLGGAIFVDSEPGKGTTFRIYLPKTDRTAQAAEAPQAAGAERHSDATILIVEDEASVLALARAALSRHGYTLLEAGSAEAALTILGDRSRAVDLLLSDIVLPGLNGRALATQVARDFPETRILLMSGYADSQESGDGAADLETSVMEKPFTVQTLLTRVHAALAAPVAVLR